MTVLLTKDIVRDLMPLYLAGEVSDDTRRMMEEYLRLHPEDSNKEEGFDPLALPEAEPPEGLGLASLEKTRRLMSLRSLALAAAYAISYAVFSFRFENHQGLSFVLYRDLPVAAWSFLALALLAWVSFVALQFRWFATGLAGNTFASKGIWMMGGVLAMLPYAFVVSYRFGLDDVRAICVVGAFIGLALQQGLNRRLQS